MQDFRSNITRARTACSEPAQRKSIALTAAFAVWAGILAAGIPLIHAQGTPGVSIPVRGPRDSDQFARRPGILRVDVNLVLIPVTVTDAYEKPVRGLKKSDFRVLEDGVEQEVTRFSMEESPISIGIVFDASTSMLRKIEQSRQAVVEFLKMSMPGDEVSLLKFSDNPELVSGFTTNISEIEDGLQSIQPDGWTSLYDAIYLSMNGIKHAKHESKILLVLSDGGDNNSRYTERELKALIKEADVRIFAISILSRSPSLEALAEESGGRAFRVRKLEDLPDLAAEISKEVHSHYVLGFSPLSNARDGKYHRVRVELTQPDAISRLRTSWKHGYYGPMQ